MAMRSFNPTTPSRRFMSVTTFDDVTAKKPFKPLTIGKKRTGGRNNVGWVAIRHRGGGHKKAYRVIDFRRDKKDVPGKVASVEYDPNRSARIALIHYADGDKRYIIAPNGLAIGQVGNLDHENISLGKAGRRRWLGIRPTVRGVAMNPVDHPLGGGEGKTSGGRHPCTPWGVREKKTRNNKRTDKYIVRHRK